VAEGVVVALGEDAVEPLDQVEIRLEEHGREQLRLRVEVVVHQCRINTGLAGDRSKRGAVVALTVEEAERRARDIAASVFVSWTTAAGADVLRRHVIPSGLLAWVGEAQALVRRVVRPRRDRG
jgi:hypothetical protein